MKFSNFLFPGCRAPERDGIVIDETLREAWLSDELELDVIWLAEHHFDGICAYVDPITSQARWRPRRGTARSASPSCRPRCTTRSASPNS